MSGFATGGRTHDVQVVTAVGGEDWDSRLVKALETAPGRIAVVRRCVDVVELVACVQAGIGQAVLLSADIRRLDREVVATLHRSGVAVIGVGAAAGTSGREHLERLGVRHVVPIDIEPAALAETVVTAIADAGVAPTAGVPAVVAADGADALMPGSARRAVDDRADELSFVESSGQDGTLIAVWGPCGAPGRTTVAVNIAMEAALLGETVMLADADTYGACIAQVLGLLDESAGLAGAAQLANDGLLDPLSLARHARRVTPDLHVLTGIARPSRWTELRSSALVEVWQQTRSVSAVTVADCGFCLEEDEALSFDTAAPQRNQATLATLEEADLVVAVGAGDPIGLARLVRGLTELDDVVPRSRVVVVVNRVRRSVTGVEPQRQIAAALERYAGRTNPEFIPDDPAAVDAAIAGGLTLAEAAPTAPARAAAAGLTRRLLGHDQQARRRGLLRLRHASG